MSARVQREQEEVQRRVASLAESGLKQEAEAQRLLLERRSWQDGEAERSRMDAAARESKQQAQHLKVPLLHCCCCFDAAARESKQQSQMPHGIITVLLLLCFCCCNAAAR